MLSREEILQQMRERVHHPAGTRELLQALKIPKEERATFRRHLKGLVADGDLIEIRGQRFGLPEKMDLYVGRLQTHPAGYGFVTPERDIEAGGDIFISPTHLNEAMHGDRVVVRIERVKDDGRVEGRVIRVLERAHSSMVGRYDQDPQGVGFVVPFDRRVLIDIFVPSGQEKGAVAGQMVVVELTRWPSAGRGAIGRVLEVLGDIDAPGVDTEIIIRKHGIPDAHSDESITQALRLGTAVRERDIRGRSDFRDLQTVTIDGEHARDFDDAITIETLPNGHYWLGVHIADVSHYVEEGSALDREAYERGTSVYFPERAVHMFPSELSTGLCSLNPHVDRLVQTCFMEVTRRGEVVRSEFHDGVIHSNERMTYTAVNGILTERDPELMTRYEPLVPMFETMRELFQILNAARHRRGSIDFDLNETEIIMDSGGMVEAIVALERNIAHRIIEEFMLLANETVASHLESQSAPRPVPDSRRAGPAEGGEVRRVRLDVRPEPRGAAHGAAAAALPAAHRKDFRPARRETDCVPDAADHAEGSLLAPEQRALRPCRAELHALHVANSPLSRPGRPSSAAGGTAGPAVRRTEGGRAGRPAGGCASHVGNGAPRRRCRARTAAVEEGEVHGRQGRR